MPPVRLFGRVHPTRRQPVETIRLRVQARDTPTGAAVEVTDIQLQPGRLITGWIPAPPDLGIQAVGGYQWRSGVITGDCTLVVIADEATASPIRWEITRAGGTIQLGDYHCGPVIGTAIVDGITGTATHGAGVPPHLSARADIEVPVHSAGRACLSVSFRGLAQVVLDPPPPDPDPIDPDEIWDDEDEPEPEEPPVPPPVDPEDPGDTEEEE